MKFEKGQRNVSVLTPHGLWGSAVWVLLASRQKISTLESVVGGLMCHGSRARVLVV